MSGVPETIVKSIGVELNVGDVPGRASSEARRQIRLDCTSVAKMRLNQRHVGIAAN
jgi:hypothetical protein